MESVVVTGANRGIGLEFVRQLVNSANPPCHVFATYRDINSVQALNDIRNTSKKSEVILIKMDIRKIGEIEAARKIVEDMVGERGLCLLINNAAALRILKFPDITEDNISFHCTTNAVGPVLVLKEMLPLLQKAAQRKRIEMGVSRAAVINMSSMGGSIGIVHHPLPIEWLALMAYRMSKASLNMAMRIVAQEVKDKGILVVNMCPGWVLTDMGTSSILKAAEGAKLTVEESVSAMMKTFPLLNETHHGSFLDRNGRDIPF